MSSQGEFTIFIDKLGDRSGTFTIKYTAKSIKRDIYITALQMYTAVTVRFTSKQLLLSAFALLILSTCPNSKHTNHELARWGSYCLTSCASTSLSRIVSSMLLHILLIWQHYSNNDRINVYMHIKVIYMYLDIAIVV